MTVKTAALISFRSSLKVINREPAELKPPKFVREREKQ